MHSGEWGAHEQNSKGRMLMKARHRWAVPVLAGLMLVAAVMVVTASTAAPQDDWAHVRFRLSDPETSAAYPEIGVGADGLVVAVWTEGTGSQLDKHNGALKLGWISDSSPWWKTVTIDPLKVFDTAMTLSGSTVHVVWSRDKTHVYYTTCAPPLYDCAGAEIVAVATSEALQLDIVLDGSNRPHVVWVEDDNKIYYTRRQGAIWNPKAAVGGSADSAGPALAHAGGLVHLVWTEWQDVAHTDSEVQYCRRGVDESIWSWCIDPLAQWEFQEYLARNVSIAADGAGNVYVVWDILSDDDTGSQRNYAIAYRHSADNGQSWRLPHTYPAGNEFGNEFSGAQIFKSAESELWAEYVRFLRPYVSLAISGTQTVPVLAWHERASTSGGGGPGLALVAADDKAYKVFWDYARQPSSDLEGKLVWASEAITLSTDFCGVSDMKVDSATGRIAIAGDLAVAKGGGGGGNHLHVFYHEQVGADRWGVFYNSNEPVTCFHVRMPVLLENADGGGGR
jgi:hypothetical protein